MLTIIDSYYLIQMNKRLFGTDEIAEHLISVTNLD